MKQFIEGQIDKYGSFDKAVEAYEQRTGKTGINITNIISIYECKYNRKIAMYIQHLQ